MPKTVKLNDEPLALQAAALPSLPEKAQKVLNLLSDPDVSVEKLRRLIAEDPPLAARMLSIANFNFYGGGKTLPNLTQAIMRLGFNAVRNIVVALSMKKVFKRFGRDEELLWEGMMGSAMASSIIARHTKLTGPEDAFIGGLLHDAGKVYLINERPDAFRRALLRSESEGIRFDAAVMGELNFDHRQAGSMMARKWGFPETLVNMVKNFENPDELLKERFIFNLVAIITFADCLCLKLGIGCKGPQRVIPPSDVESELANLSDSLGVNEASFKMLVENIQAAFSQGIQLY